MIAITKSKATKTKKSAMQRVPDLRMHKQSHRCYATFNGKAFWFGKRGETGTQARFDAHLA